MLAKGTPSDGHGLTGLFEQLDPESQELVRSGLELKVGDFDAELRAVSKVFVEWRYIYETPGYHSVNLPFLQLLWGILGELAERAARPARSFKADAPGGTA